MNFVHQESKTFYDREYRKDYAPTRDALKHPFFSFLSRVIDEYGLKTKKCLEVGCGRGALQDMVADYTGVDLSEAVRPFLTKPFYACSATSLPFADNSFDVVWTYAVLEHIPDPEIVFREMRRVIVPGGILILHAAWHCPFYAAQGYPVRAYREFNVMGKILKFLAHLHHARLCRAISIVMLRSWILLRECFPEFNIGENDVLKPL